MPYTFTHPVELFENAGGHPDHISNPLHLQVDGTGRQVNISTEVISRLSDWRKFVSESGWRESSRLIICHPARELDVEMVSETCFMNDSK
jgi:hypothetical protein